MRTLISTSAAIIACSVTMLLTAGPAQAVNCAKNPSHRACGEPPPPPPEIDRSACQDSAGEFPALAYFKDKVTITTRGKKVITTVTGREIYVANNHGDCSILIATTDFSGPYLKLAYHFVNGEGKIALGLRGLDGQPAFVKLIKFQASSKVITSNLPADVNTVFTNNVTSEPVAISDMDLSSSGLIAFSTGQNTGNQTTFRTIRVVDVSNCDSGNCPTDTLISQIDWGRYELGFGPSGNRIYINRSERDANDEPVGRIDYVDNLGSGWSGLQNLFTAKGAAYNNGYGRQFRDPSAMLWDYDNDGTAEEVLTYMTNTEIPADDLSVDIMDVNSGLVIRSGYAGDEPSFTSSPSNGAAMGIIVNDNGQKLELDADTGAMIRNLGELDVVDSAD